MSARKIPVVNPATEKVIAQVPDQGAAEIDRAVGRAKKAWQSWRGVPAHEKAELLHEVSHRIKARSDELSRLLTTEGGKPFRENKDEMGWSASCFDYYAEIARNSR